MEKYIIFFLILLSFGCSNDNKKEIKSVESNSKSTNEDMTSNLNSSFLIEGKDLSIHLPEDWIKEGLSEDTYAFRENCPDTAIFCTNLVVRFVKNENKLDADQVVESFASSLPQRFETMKIVSVADQKIGGSDFKIIDYKVFENDVHLGSSTAFLLYKDEIISFYFTSVNKPAGAFAKKRKLFLDILKSVTFD